jgi:ABC-type amino acid transport substrate-binding protein
MNKALNQVNKMIIKITPLGVFSIAAGVVSSLSWADLSRLQGYLLIYLVAVIIMTFIVLPYVISIFTPYSSRTIFKITRSTLITIFATGKIIVVFPQLIENIKEIIATEEGNSDEARSEIDIIMPLAYPFPNLGTFLIFIFAPFAAWYSGHALYFSDYPLFLSATFLSSFVAPITGLPFTLDVLDIPSETFNLFVVSTVLTDRIRVVLGAFHLITLTLLSISASQGFLKFKKAKFLQALIVVSITFAVSIYGMNKLLTENMKSIPTNSEIVNQFKIISPMQDFVILDKAVRNPNWRRQNESSLNRIKRRGIIRIGFYKNAMPFTFFNTDSALVGMGIDLAHQLAYDLKVSIEFVPINRGELVKGFKKDYYDIVMSDIFISNSYAEKLELSHSYLSVSLALVTRKDDDRFNSMESVLQVDSLNICYFERKEVADEYASSFEHAKVFPITDINQFFNPNKSDSISYDAYLTSAERASSLTIIYPGFKVANPLPYHINNALVFPIAKSNIWKKYIDNWIEFRKQDGTIDRIYKQWILGQEYKKKERNWNLYDDVIAPKYFAKKKKNKIK